MKEQKQKNTEEQPNNPLHGIKLADMLKYLHSVYNWEGLGTLINIRCFNYDPSISSSLKFLRRTQWAKEKVEQLYLETIKNGKINVQPAKKNTTSKKNFFS